MPERYAILIGIESYHNAAMAGVRFARADAEAFKKLLIEKLEVPAANISLLLDADAHKANIEDQLKYFIHGLDEDDHFFFFYAGHGLWANGSNRLTTWDTQPLNLSGTTINVEDLLLGPLRSSGCKHSAIFIDACASEFHDPGRDIISDMHPREFETFISTSQYTAAFFACSPKEKSYSTSALGHGIWTHHLLRALRGDEAAAIVKEKWVTGESLRDYLNAAVPKFIRKSTKIKGHQQPYALIGASGTFLLAEVKEPTASSELRLRPDFGDANFRGQVTRSFKSLPGFSSAKGHRVPVGHSDSADEWARKLLGDEIAEEVQTVYENAKTTLSLKSREIDKQEDTGAGSVDTEIFRFSVEAGQSGVDHTEAVVKRKIQLRVPHSKLPDDFDSIFPNPVDKLVLPLPGSKGQFQALMDAIEDAADQIKASVKDDPTKGTIELRLRDGTVVLIRTKSETMTVYRPGLTGCVEIIEHLKGDDLKKVLGQPPKLIGRA